MARNRAVERALQTHGRGPLLATAVIVVLGLILVAWLISPTERKRRALLDDLAVGSDTALVIRALGEPVRCAAGGLERFREGFPTDWPRPVTELAVADIGARTTQRWIYAINPRTRLPCDSEQEHTEIGIGADGRVLWHIAVTGKTPIELPEAYTPSGGES